MTLTYPKSLRLKRSSEFLRVKKEGRSYGGRYMVLGILKDAGETKAGLITSRRVGGAVERNRARRRLREVLRLSRPQWGASGAWVVLIAKSAAVNASFEELQREWMRLSEKARLVAIPKD